jgi:hypothetical protein
LSPADTARSWMVAIGAELLKAAIEHNAAESKLLDKINVIVTCAELPDDMVLRLRCTPNVWRLRA